MKAIGIVRKLDQLGRIVLPKDLRRTMKILDETPMEILVEGDTVILRKYEPCCVFCGEGDGVTVYKDKHICGQCRAELETKKQITVKNQLNDGLTIEFCCGEAEYVLAHNQEVEIEIEGNACMYFDSAYKAEKKTG